MGRKIHHQCVWPFPITEDTTPNYIRHRALTTKQCAALMVHDDFIEDHNHDVRRIQDYAHLMPDTHAWLYEKITAIFLRHNVWRFGLSGIYRPITLLRYKAGYRTRKHTDWVPGDLDYGKVTMTVPLGCSDNIKGGKLHIDEDTEPVPFSPGVATLFPSFLMHHVTPVLRGTRFVIVAWASGPSPV